MSRQFPDEDAWLRGVHEHLAEIVEDPEEYVEDWNLESEEGVTASMIKKRAAALGCRVDEVLATPMDRRGAVSW